MTLLLVGLCVAVPSYIYAARRYEAGCARPLGRFQWGLTIFLWCLLASFAIGYAATLLIHAKQRGQNPGAVVWTPALLIYLGTIGWLIYGTVHVALTGTDECDRGLRTSTIVVVAVAWSGVLALGFMQAVASATLIKSQLAPVTTHAAMNAASSIPGSGAARGGGIGVPVPPPTVHAGALHGSTVHVAPAGRAMTAPAPGAPAAAGQRPLPSVLGPRVADDAAPVMVPITTGERNGPVHAWPPGGPMGAPQGAASDELPLHGRALPAAPAAGTGTGTTARVALSHERFGTNIVPAAGVVTISSDSPGTPPLPAGAAAQKALFGASKGIATAPAPRTASMDNVPAAAATAAAAPSSRSSYMSMPAGASA